MSSAVYAPSIFTDHEGGVDGEDVIYFLGIIDILQTYNRKKKMEHMFKSIITSNKSAISAVDAAFYADRFLSFIFASIDSSELT